MLDIKPKQKKRIRDPEKTREKILKATVDLVAEKGLEALSMKEAALRADVSRSVAYLHFDDREHLLREAKAWMSERMQHGVVKFDASTELYDRVLYSTRLILQNPVSAKVMMMDALSAGELHLHDPLFQLIADRLKKLKRAGKVSADVDIEALTFIHLGASTVSALLLWEQHKDEDPEKLAKRFAKEWTRILERGMFVDPKDIVSPSTKKK